MKSDKTLIAKVLIVTTKELSSVPGINDACEFEVLEFENGLIVVEGSTTNDWYFEARSCIEPCGTAVVASINESGETRQWNATTLLKSVQGSIKEFGVDAVPNNHFELWKQTKKK